jgi:hypothetical protein
MLYGGIPYCIIIVLFVHDVNTKLVLIGYVGAGVGLGVGEGVGLGVGEGVGVGVTIIQLEQVLAVENISLK